MSMDAVIPTITTAATTNPMIKGILVLDDAGLEAAHVSLLERHRKLFPPYL